MDTVSSGTCIFITVHSVRQIHRTVGPAGQICDRSDLPHFPVWPNCPMLFKILCMLFLLGVRQIEDRSYKMILLTGPNVLWSSTKFRGQCVQVSFKTVDDGVTIPLQNVHVKIFHFTCWLLGVALQAGLLLWSMIKLFSSSILASSLV